MAIMLQFLVDLSRKHQHKSSTKSTTTMTTQQKQSLSGSNNNNSDKPTIVRSPSSTSSIDTWSTLLEEDDWHDDKQCWSFKDDYVSFPSLEETEDSTILHDLQVRE
ncbi:hypothetical protein BDA99DRAFT_559955 [Phascolomyces articulosus]|uniref:Peptidase S59 domain-containing protein n=1 Tax=Phascolomyces articulosus TaxID=60185 RepID=A0AAD5K0I8_9FUNG|nr:hypothetical protein BDA99DRAFT_559955 [Phascolomyces articulosus]